ncbi:MAG: DUF4003 family protein [Clostridiales bacterium]|nr:DUF4003 family protein [Clostridiales bacterium]
MDNSVNEKCELLSNNRSIIHKSFLFEKEPMSVIAALIYTSAGKEADTEKMKSCRKLLKKNTRPLSGLRDIVELVLLSKMALSEDPERYLSDLIAVYEKITTGNILETDYMILSAILILDLELQDNCDEIITRAKELTKEMNSKHPILTASDDASFIMFLAITQKSIDDILADLEEGFTYITNTCKFNASSDAIYELCEVLALSYGDMKDKCDKALRIYKVLKDHKIDYVGGSNLSELGALIDIDLDPETIANEIIKTEEYLKGMTGFKESSCDRKTRVMYASYIIADIYGKNTESAGNAVISNTVSFIRAKQIANMISIISSVGSSALSSAIKTEENC